MLQGKTAVITGGSRGIGRAIALNMAKNGADIAIIYNGNTEKAEETAKQIISDYNVKCMVYKCDVSCLLSCIDTVKNIIDDLGGIDILVNNAGQTKDGLILSMSEDDFDSVIKTNLNGAFNMIKSCGRNFLKKKSGKIINITSVSAMFGTAGQANYASSKAGLIALTKVTAREFASRGVTCNAIAPGFIVTDMTDKIENPDEYINRIPLKRCGTPDDVASLAVFLASNMSDYITGEVIRIDGGLAM